MDSDACHRNGGPISLKKVGFKLLIIGLIGSIVIAGCSIVMIILIL